MHIKIHGNLTTMAASLGVSELCCLLGEKGLDSDVIELFRSNKIDGAVFLDLNKEELKELGVVALGDRKKIEKIRNLQPSSLA